MDSKPLLEFKQVKIRFETEEVLNGIDFSIRDGEFFTLLGPSGCGKTTILRLIAGFETANEGTILLDGQPIGHLPTEKRPVNTVFQNYALFPHLSVFENVAFGLRMAGVPKDEIKRRVSETLATVQLTQYAQRKPHQLSGGQKQRVAIARAVINRPRLLLLDESLSALDYKLRQQMQIELKQLQRQLGITFVYVTHDQEEALSMSDRILVLNHGQVQQLGTPREIYESPSSLFVAGFIGEINIFDARVKEVLAADRYLMEFTDCEREVFTDSKFQVGNDVHVLLRPEDLRVEYMEDAPNRPGFTGEVVERNYKGKTLDSLIRLDIGKDVMASEFFDEHDPDFDYRHRQRVWVDWVHGWEYVIRAEG